MSNLQMIGSVQGYYQTTKTGVSTPKIILKKMTFNAADADSNQSSQVDGIYTNYNDLTFNLRTPLQNVVFVDWATVYSITSPICFLRINELQNNGITSIGESYFTTLIQSNGTKNILVQSQPPSVYAQPVNLSSLTFKLFGPALNQPLTWAIELYFYVLE